MLNTEFYLRSFGVATPTAKPTTSQKPVIKWKIGSSTIVSGQTEDYSFKYDFNSILDT